MKYSISTLYRENSNNFDRPKAADFSPSENWPKMVPEGVRNGENVKFSGGTAFRSKICKTLVFNGICVKIKTASIKSRSG